MIEIDLYGSIQRKINRSDKNKKDSMNKTEMSGGWYCVYPV